MRIVCSGYLVRHPVGGLTWHHLQYLVGLAALGHDVFFIEEAGWPLSCYDPLRDEMTDDCEYGTEYVSRVLTEHGLGGRWCYIDMEGRAHGCSPSQLTEWLRESDLYLSLSNMNAFPETKLARRRALVDTDPVFAQIRAHGLEDPEKFDVRFTFGENVGRQDCAMPTGGLTWLPTRQPVVLELWPVTRGDPSSPLSTVMNWAAYGSHIHEGRLYGQKDRELLTYVDIAERSPWALEIGLSGAPGAVVSLLREKGWHVVEAHSINATPTSYQEYLGRSAGEFSVAKHAYVTTSCGWFSDRTCGYLASGRPAVVQDTGFSRNIPTGEGLLAFRTPAEAVEALRTLTADYDNHCTAARAVAESYFDSRHVLEDLLAASL